LLVARYCLLLFSGDLAAFVTRDRFRAHGSLIADVSAKLTLEPYIDSTIRMNENGNGILS
jgi:hypothetical protein